MGDVGWFQEANKLRPTVQLIPSACFKFSCNTSERTDKMSPSYVQERIQILWGLKLMQFWGLSFKKKNIKLRIQIRYESECLFRAPPRALEGAPKLKFH